MISYFVFVLVQKYHAYLYPRNFYRKKIILEAENSKHEITDMLDGESSASFLFGFVWHGTKKMYPFCVILYNLFLHGSSSSRKILLYGSKSSMI